MVVAIKMFRKSEIHPYWNDKWNSCERNKYFYRKKQAAIQQTMAHSVDPSALLLKHLGYMFDIIVVIHHKKNDNENREIRAKQNWNCKLDAHTHTRKKVSHGPM